MIADLQMSGSEHAQVHVKNKVHTQANDQDRLCFEVDAFVWTIPNFTTSKDKRFKSKSFDAHGVTW